MSKTHLPVGAKIRGLRGQTFTSQIELAKAIGVNQATLSRIEKGRLPLSPKIKAAIEKHFNVSLDDDSSSGIAGQLSKSPKFLHVSA